jgi:trimethylamine--corrinoid protein Co-methyltransferase
LPRRCRTRRRRGCASAAGGRPTPARRRGDPQLPWTDVINIDHPTEPLPPEGVEAVHDGAMRVLEEIGIEFLNEEAVAVLRDAGCIVDGENVRMGRDLVMEMVGKAPREFTLTPRNPDRKITIGGKHLVFGNISSPPNCSDIERGGAAATARTSARF